MDLHVFPILIPPPTTLSTRFLWVFPVHQAWALNKSHLFLKRKNQALALKQTNLVKIIHVKKLILTVHDFESGITLWPDFYCEEIILVDLWEVCGWSLGTCRR